MFRSPERPILKISVEFIIPPTSVDQSLKALQLKLIPTHIVQVLRDDDFHQKVEFAYWFSMCYAEPSFPPRILWTGGGFFKT